MTITKKIRFEVFKRDNFQCKYCGRSAPDVILEVDHINPRDNGGEDSMFNLITSCFDCNRGKGKRKLSDKTEFKKQKKELEKVQKEREQLKLLKKWRDEIKNVDEEYIDYFSNIIDESCNCARTLSEFGKKKLLKLIKKYDKKELSDAIEISFRQYFIEYEDIEETSNTWKKSFNYIEKIICSRKAQEKNPQLKNIYYCRSILRNRLNYINEWQTKSILKELLDNFEFDDVKDFCCQVKNWTDFKKNYEKWNKLKN